MSLQIRVYKFADRSITLLRSNSATSFPFISVTNMSKPTTSEQCVNDNSAPTNTKNTPKLHFLCHLLSNHTGQPQLTLIAALDPMAVINLDWPGNLFHDLWPTIKKFQFYINRQLGHSFERFYGSSISAG